MVQSAERGREVEGTNRSNGNIMHENNHDSDLIARKKAEVKVVPKEPEEKSKAITNGSR